MGAILPLAAECQIRHARSRYPEEASTASSRECSRIELVEEEIATAMKATANAKAVGPDGLPAELLKLGLQQETRPFCWSSTDSPPSSGAKGTSHSSGKMRSLPYSQTTAASRSCLTRVRCPLKWLPGDSALTVRRRDCYRRSSAGFDRIAPPRT